MPWAANGQISTGKIPGGVQISDAQYAAALSGILSGKLVSIDGGFSIIDPPEPEPQPGPDAEPKKPTLDDYKAAFDAHLDAVAQQRQYDNRMTITSYVTSGDALWAAEAQTFVTWRDAALASMFLQLSAVQAGEIELPAIEKFISAIPDITWPK